MPNANCSSSASSVKSYFKNSHDPGSLTVVYKWQGFLLFLSASSQLQRTSSRPITRLPRIKMVQVMVGVSPKLSLNIFSETRAKAPLLLVLQIVPVEVTQSLSGFFQIAGCHLIKLVPEAAWFG